MKFGSRPLQECEGAILAHTLRLGSGSIRKGRVLTRDDLERIAAAGHAEIVVAALEEGDIGENEAADRVARLLAGAHVAPAPAATGRCNLIARRSGVLLLDADEINRLNSVCETVTVATLPPFTPVGKGDAVATIKIIPYAISASVMDRISRGARPALEVRPYLEARCGLVITQVVGGRASLADKAAHALQARLERVGLSVADEIRCPHEEEAVADAIGSLAARGCAPIFIFGAAAACDRGDVVPAAIERSGGRILHFGMPVEPGNLLVLGERAGASVIGMPSCARSLAPNGFDWVLHRILAGIPVTEADIVAMGVGGLITGRAEAAKKRRPVLPEQHSDRFVTTPPRIAAVVLAAGRARRMGDVNKLTRPIAGKAMLRHVAEAALTSQASPVIVVTGHQEESVRAALEGLE
ncbi:MAG: 4-diphosphocytidyl-2C-methyl-D-erythritol kinase, partial [Alphaproteobacteria bacterium]